MKISRKKLRSIIVEVLDLNVMNTIIVPRLLSGDDEQIAQAIELGRMNDQNNIAKDYITSSLEKGPGYLVDEFNTAFNLNSFSETDEDEFLQIASLVASSGAELNPEAYYGSIDKEQKLQNAKILLRYVIDKDR